MKTSLSTTYLDNLKCPAGQVELPVFDAMTPGLCIRVTTNKKSWSFLYTIPRSAKRKARLALGTYPATSLAAARKKALDARGHVEAGIDPATVLAVPVAPMTMAELCALRIAKEVRAKGQSEFRSADQIERRYNQDIIPVVGSVAVKEFRRKHYNQVIEKIADRECFVLANRVHCDLKRLMKFAVRRDEIDFSPLAELDPPYRENSRERNLSLTEIVHFWHASPKALIRSPKVQTICKLLLATGKRSDQVCGMKREELDFSKRLWTIPKARVKGMEDDARDEQVPLSEFAISLLWPVLQSHNNEYVFPNDDGEGAYVPGVVSKAIKIALDEAPGLPLGRLGMAKWTPHDLRRTVGTQLLSRDNGLGLTKEQKYLVLNHIAELEKNVSDRVYDQNDYLPEKRDALDKWGTFLAALVAPAQQREAA